MKKYLILCLLIFFGYNLFSQVIYEEIASEKLGTTRKIKIQLPRNYSTQTDKKYPIVLVLDGDYLFEPVAGNVDYFAYWEDMPQAIVVGIMQGEDRYLDCSFDPVNYVPDEDGSKFFEFIGLELMPYIDKKYRTAKFILGVGHDFTANFLNYYLFKSPPLFNGYIMLSPDLAPMMEDRLAERIPDIQENIFYYLATGSEDIQKLKESTEKTKNKLQSLNSNNFHFYYDNFQDATHYSLVAKGIPNALDEIFSIFRPITPSEYSDVLLKSEETPFEYLEKKYKVIEDLFGLKPEIRMSDLFATAKASETRRDWDSLEKIAKLARKHYPNSVIGEYYLARYYEENNNLRKAIRTYRAGFDKEGYDFITPALMLEKGDDLKKGADE